VAGPGVSAVDNQTRSSPDGAAESRSLKELLHMSIPRTIPPAEWKAFFDRMSKALLGKWAEIEVASLDIGDQIVATWIPMLGITYDSRNDLLDVALDGTSHLIRHPTEILVEEDSTGLRSVAVVDGDGARQIVSLKDPLLLPPAEVHQGT